MNHTKKLIEETRRLRAEATHGEWSDLEEDCEIHAINFIDNGGDPLHIAHDINTKQNCDFIIHAANNIDRLARMVECALEGLNSIPDDLQMELGIDHVLQNIERIASEGK